MTQVMIKTLSALCLTVFLAAPAVAETLGPVTQMPLPRFVSLKAGEANVRRGPSMTHRIDWVFQKRGMPLQVTAEHGHWRRVQDRDGQGGWMHYAMLSGSPTALIVSDLAAMHRQPTPDAPVVARAQRDVVVRINRCDGDWCRVSAGPHRGWVQIDQLWGATVLADE